MFTPPDLSDGDATQPDDDDSSPPDTDPWPDGVWPDSLTCEPGPAESGIVCDLVLPDQFGNEVHLWEFYGRPFVLHACLIYSGYADDCQAYIEPGLQARADHAAAGLEWVTVLASYDSSITGTTVAAIATDASPPFAILLDQGAATVSRLPMSGMGIVGIAGVHADMRHDGWPPDYTYASEIRDLAAELIASDAE
jgi:hypothetical protein